MAGEYCMDNQLYDNLALCARAIGCPVRQDIGQGSRILAVFGIDVLQRIECSSAKPKNNRPG